MGADQSGLNVRGDLDEGWLALDELHLAGCKFDRMANGASLGNTRTEREETFNVRATRCMVHSVMDRYHVVWSWSWSSACSRDGAISQPVQNKRNSS
jgi:hypothetical protein